MSKCVSEDTRMIATNLKSLVPRARLVSAKKSLRRIRTNIKTWRLEIGRCPFLELTLQLNSRSQVASSAWSKSPHFTPLLPSDHWTERHCSRNHTTHSKASHWDFGSFSVDAAAPKLEITWRVCTLVINGPLLKSLLCPTTFCGRIFQSALGREDAVLDLLIVLVL